MKLLHPMQITCYFAASPLPALHVQTSFDHLPSHQGLPSAGNTRINVPEPPNIRIHTPRSRKMADYSGNNTQS